MPCLAPRGLILASMWTHAVISRVRKRDLCATGMPQNNRIQPEPIGLGFGLAGTL